MQQLHELVQADDPILRALRIGPHHFPGVWAYMMPREFLALKFPAERRATCMNCPKSCFESFRADYRCCTYLPRVPAFLLGLASLTEKGFPMIERLIERRLLLPEGMHYAPGQWVDYLDDLEHERFGQSEKVLCPHLEESSGYCQIHAFRNSVCSTFFCLKDHGDPGDSFWGRIQTLGSQIEMALGQWALEEAGFDLKRYFETFDRLAANIHKVSDRAGWREEAWLELWGEWSGRELELMQGAAAAVVRHREHLWEIANSFPIQESQAFDRAMVRAVPRRLKNQVDPEDLDAEAGDAAKPRDLWTQCLKSYYRLWELPEGYYSLASRVDIQANPRNDKESEFYSDQPYCVISYVRKDSKTVDWRLFISEKQKELLELFRHEAHQLDWRFLLRKDLEDFPDLKEFLAEMLAQKILVKRVFH